MGYLAKRMYLFDVKSGLPTLLMPSYIYIHTPQGSRKKVICFIGLICQGLSGQNAKKIFFCGFPQTGSGSSLIWKRTQLCSGLIGLRYYQKTISTLNTNLNLVDNRYLFCFTIYATIPVLAASRGMDGFCDPACRSAWLLRVPTVYPLSLDQNLDFTIFTFFIRLQLVY